MSSLDYRPRLSIEITEEQARKLTRSLEWGERRRLFAIIVDDLLAAFDRYGADKVIGALKARELNTFDIVKLNLKEPE